MKNRTHHSRLLKISIICFLLLATFAIPEKAFSQNGGYTPGGLLDTVIDYLGNKYSLGEIAINDTTRAAARGRAPEGVEVDSCTSGYFQMYLESGCGLEGTAPANVARRTVVCRVLYDISQFIRSPLATSLTGQKINIWVRNPDSVGSLPPNFAGVAASFYNVPSSTTISGIEDNAVWITLNSGTDAYRNVASPLATAGGSYSYGATFFHGWMAFKFDGSITWNTSLTSAPTSGAIDLYTVALHEMLHALGFMSLIDYNGTSRLGTGFNYFTRYDQHLHTSAPAGVPLIKTSDACDLYQWGFNSSLTPSSVLSPGGTGVCPSGFDTGAFIDDTVCAHAVDFVDASMTQPVYTPNCYQKGSSLSHFEDLCQVPASFILLPPASNNQYFLMSNAIIPGPYVPTTSPGAMKRFPKPEERQVLCDIGYIVDTAFGDITNLNFENYHTTLCGEQVAGINDGIDSGGAYSFFSTGGSVTINGGTAGSLLNNDHNANKFTCLEVLTGGGAVSISSGTSATVVNFTPALGAYGIQLLRYIPKDSVSGTEGNITYVYVYVGDAGCTPTACNLVANGGFENVVPGTSGSMEGVNANEIHCWSAFSESPDLFSRGGTSDIPGGFCTPPTDVHFPGTTVSLPNDHFIGLIGYGSSSVPAFHLSEGLQSPLSSSILPSTTYVISCWAKLAYGNPIFTEVATHVQFAVAPSIVPLAPIPWSIASLPAGLTSIKAFNIPADRNWHYCSDTFFYSGTPGNTLVAFNATYLNPSAPPYTYIYETYLLLDDVSITTALSTATFTLPVVLCNTGSFINLDTTVTIPGGTFSWLTDSSGYAVTTHSSLFKPDSAYYASLIAGDTSLITVCYTYTNAIGCIETICATTHIYRIPSPITGANVICAGSTTALTDTALGGIWSSSNTSVATIDSVTGVLTGIAGGTTTIAYANFCGTVTKTMTINAVPAAIAGLHSVCDALNITLTEASPGGTWTSSNTFVAIVYSGLVLAVSPGVDTITYAFSTGCAVTYSVTVDPVPDVIVGLTSMCVGSITDFTNSVAGGIWSSSNTLIATVSSGTGIVTALSSGTATITYTLAPCGYVTETITVNLAPAPITGSHTVCLGSTITLSDITAGATWTCRPPSTATITAIGVVTGMSVGTAIITYGFGTGCSATDTITVDTIPSVITGPSFVCANSMITFGDSVAGGTWSSSSTTLATVGSGTGIITGIASGTPTITYTISPGCFVIKQVTVNPTPAPISGAGFVCVGLTINLTDGTPGGTWSCSPSGIATIASTGVVTGVSTGVAIVSYSFLTGCAAVDTITINPLPPSVTGPDSVCSGSTVTLTDGVAGGTWSSSLPPLATIDATSGIVTGMSPGLLFITYTLPTGCITLAPLVVHPLPMPVTGPDSVCVDSTIHLSDPTIGGVWNAGPGSIITITATGTVTGITPGTGVVDYLIGFGCFVTDTITVLTTPEVGPLTGFDTICVGSVTTFADTYPGGTWSSSNPGVAIVDLFGHVVGRSLGTDTIIYTVTGLCGTEVRTRPVHVIGLPATPPPITGAPGVCSGDTYTLFDSEGGGTWTSSNTAIASIDPGTGVVTGIAGGTATITYAITGLCGPSFITRTIGVNMAPYITTNTIVACQTYGDSVSGNPAPGAGEGHMLPDSGCILVCDSSIVRYYGNGDAGSVFTWVVVGGIVVANYGDSADIEWPLVGTTGTVTLFDTVSHCTGEAIACVQVIERPDADFSATATNVCIGDNVIFTDLSTADSLSPIVSWYWSFGDGGFASVRNPTHTYTTSGTDTVTLVVKNACSCSDTFQMILNISSTPGPVITCASVVCDSELATYSTGGGCGSYDWSVAGGTIVSGLGTSSIQVRWDHVGPDGFGYVSLDEPCGGSLICDDTTTIKIPVILQSPVIEGPSVVCAGEQYEYSFPLWPATQYAWGMLDHPSAIVGYRNDYKVAVEFTSAGTDTLHGWYQNKIKLCGANVDKIITVVPAAAITGITSVCQYTADTFSVPAIYSGNWTLSNVITGTVIATGTGSTFDSTFSTPGTYLLSVTGNFCANPVTITVTGAPAAIDSVAGPDTVCLDRVYNYTAFFDAPGTSYSWQAIGGTVSPASGSATVSVTWTSGSTKQLIVSRSGTVAPYCNSLPTIINITQEVINPHITGDTTACANSYKTYNSNYLRGDTYDWTIFPNTAGSVIGSGHSPTDTILWNNVTLPTSALIILTIHKCDNVVLDTFHVTINTSAAATLSAAPDTVCPGAPVTFTGAIGGGTYTWDFGDGSGSSGSASNTFVHAFPPNTATSNLNYIVFVTIAPNPFAACPVAGTASVVVSVLPGPEAFLSTSVPWLCALDTDYLVGTVTSNVSGLTYAWSLDGTVIPGSMGAIDTAITLGIYTFTVTAGNGCSAVSNPLEITFGPSCGLGGDGTAATRCDFSVSSSDFCNTITLSTPVPGGTWKTLPGLTAFPTGMTTVTATYNVPGVYDFIYYGTTATCTGYDLAADVVGIVPNFYHRLRCGVGGLDTIALSDHSAYLPIWSYTATGVTWTDLTTGGGIPSGYNTVIERAPGSYRIMETVSGIRPGGTFTCSVIDTIVVPGLPVPAFVDTLSPICEGVPIDFTYTGAGGIVGYHWDFGDLSSNLLENPGRTYDWIGPATNPQPRTVILIVTDTIGCVGSVSHAVQIFHNILGGDYSSSVTSIICADAVPFILGFGPTLGTPPYNYLWSSGDIIDPISISQSGSYWVKVTDFFQCQKSFFAARNVAILQPPPAIITGKQNYCVGDMVKLAGYAGPGVTYQWWFNGMPYITSPFITDERLPAGTFYYQLVVTVSDTNASTGVITSCSNTSTIDTIYIHSLPPRPTIASVTAISCSSYELQLTASEPGSGTYNWSNGAYGAVDTIFSGGPYRVWFTDLNGCVRERDTVVPLAPDAYFPYFPAGCYILCKQQLPLTLPGVPDAFFNYWAWLVGGSVAESGTLGIMQPYSIDSGGKYQWTLDNGLCAQTSDAMNVQFIDCNGCNLDSFGVTITCTPRNPACYNIRITLYSPASGSTYTLGTDIGPVDPFSGTLSSSGFQPPMTLTFTTLLLPPPDSVTIEVTYTLPDGRKCFQKRRIPLPRCSWISERPTNPGDSTGSVGLTTIATTMANALLVFPNPTSGNVTISYDYGTDGYRERNLSVYDEMGRKMAYTIPQDVHGNWNVNTKDWVPGIYIIRMEADGKTLQTQRMVVESK